MSNQIHLFAKYDVQNSFLRTIFQNFVNFYRQSANTSGQHFSSPVKI